MSNKSLFKKKINLSTKTQLKQSHVRKLLKQLKDLYPTVTEDQWGEIFPSKCNVFQKKLKNQVQLYCIKEKDSEIEGPDLFLAPTSKQGEAIFPSLEILWRYPDFCPAYYIDSHICKFVFRGADLFLAGIDQSLSEWENVEFGTPRAIKVVDNPWPIGVGSCLRSSEEIRKGGFREKGLKILHFYTDQLWESNGAKRPHETFEEKMVHPFGYVPEGMQPQKKGTKKLVLWPSLIKMRAKGPNSSKVKGVYRRRAKARSADRPIYDNTTEDVDAVLWYHGDEKHWMVTEKKAFGTDDCWSKCESEAADPTKIVGTWYMWSEEDDEYIVGGVRCRDEVVDDWEDEVVSSDEENEEEVEPASEEEEEIIALEEEEEGPFVAAQFSASDTTEPTMEDLIMNAFMKALSKVDDLSLPMQSSDFYQQMKDIDDKIDVKQSKFKKLGKFLDYMKNEKRIKTKKKKGKILVEHIDRQQSDYRAVLGKGKSQDRLNASGLSQSQFDALLDIIANPDKYLVKKTDEKEDGEEAEDDEDAKSPEEQRLLNQINQYLYGKKSYCGKFIYTEDMIQVLFGGWEALVKHNMDGRQTMLFNEEPLDKSFIDLFEDQQIADRNVMNAFLTVMKVRLTDEMLPIPDVNMLDMLRDEGEIHLPECSWGSYSDFLTAMEQRHFFKRGRTNEQAIANPDLYYITSIRRDHPQIESFEVDAAKEESARQADDPFSDPKYDKAKVVLGGVTVVQMWKPSGRLNPIFELDNPDHSHNVLYTTGEVRRRFWDWCKHLNMILPGRDNEVKATHDLWRYVLKPKKDKQKTLPNDAPAFYPRKEVLDQFMRWCTKHCAVKTKGIRKPKFKAGDLLKISIYVEKRQGGHKQKHVTFVWNLETYGVDLDAFRKAARRKFAASSTIAELPGKNRKGKLVKIQGDRAETMEIHDLLADPDFFDIPNKFVEITNKRPM